MMSFDHWQQWAAPLDEAQLARAWAALGMVAAKPLASAATAGGIGIRRRDLSPALSGTFGPIAQAALVHAISSVQEGGKPAEWRFPAADGFVDLERGLRLDAIASPMWTQAWEDVVPAVEWPLRLCVVDCPRDEPVLPWFRLLTLDHPPAAARIRYEPEDPRLVMEWPLRLGYLPDNPARAVLDSVLSYWPSSRLSRIVPLDRDEQNCDILLHVGDAQSALEAMRVHPARCKANLVILVGADPDSPALTSQMTAVASACHASGMIAAEATSDPASLAMRINGLVESLSHNDPFDTAVVPGFQQGHVVWLSDALAATTLGDLVDRMKVRLRGLPAGTRLELPAADEGGAPEALRGALRSAPPPGAAAPDTTIDATAANVRLDALEYKHESDGASRAAEVAVAERNATEPESARRVRADRYLQQQSFVELAGNDEPATNGFILGQAAKVRMRIGPPVAGWQALPTRFADEQLPPELSQWTLTISLTEPTQLPQPLTQTVVLPREGASTACEFRFVPKALGRFDGLVTVLHRGRVLQMASLWANVAAADSPPVADAAPVLSEVIAVRHRLGDLDSRRQFDGAYVVDRAASGTPRGVALSASHAWIADIAASLEVAGDINTALSAVANSVVDYNEGLDGEAGRELLVELAVQGSWLHLHLIDPLGDGVNRPDIADKEYLQIVSAKSDAIVPFEFIYDYVAPNKDAKVCPRWREGVQEGKCPGACHPEDPATVCPMGFWGLHKVIERHQVNRELAETGKELFLQSEPGRESCDLALGTASMLASSARVKEEDLAPVEACLAQQTPASARKAATWEGWATIVASDKPGLIIALPHADGIGAHVSLEIGGDTLDTIQLQSRHLRPSPESPRPLVALLGCDTAGTARDYGNHVAVFRARGAAVVIATIATVFGAHAARTAALLAETLLPTAGEPPQRLGEAIRALKRQALLQGLLMPLCVVAYGDADWRLTR